MIFEEEECQIRADEEYPGSQMGLCVQNEFRTAKKFRAIDKPTLE
jgi:hypothetical protein